MRMVLIAALAGAMVLLAAGCATSTRVMGMGPLPTGDHLVTVVVSEDRAVVERECADVPSVGPVLGCHLWRRVIVPGTGRIQLVKIVRFAESVPSALSFEIDVHELCHAIAALQSISDPCHADNGGVVTAGGNAVR